MNYNGKLGFKALLFDNMVLERGLLIAPVVVMSYNLKYALVLSFAFAVITFCTVLLSVFIPKAIPYTIRVIVNVVIASLVFIPVALLIDLLEVGLVYHLGIFLPLLVTNSLIVQKSETRFRKAPSKSKMMFDLALQIIGFALVACLVGILREVIGNGTVLGHQLGSIQTAPALLLPFGGFLLIGYFSAAINRLKERFENNSGKRG